MPATTRAPQTDDLWRLTMEHSPVGMAVVSPAGDFLSTNVALCDMLGYDPDVLATMSFQDITHPDDLASDLRLVEQTLSGEIGSYRITKRYICADGGVLIGDLSVALLRAGDGAPIHFISQIADLTERQAFVERLDAAEAAAESEQGRADALFESVTVGLLHIDADGNHRAINRRQEEFLRITFPHGHLGVAGETGFAYDAEQRRLLTRDEMPSARAAAGEVFDDLLVWIGEDPQARRAVLVSARPIHDRVGGFAGAVLAYHDVTDRIRAEAVKDEFVSTVSHELRTPLTSALAYLELLEESADLGAEGHQQVSAARRNMLRLSHLVADLLFATRATAGSAIVSPYPLDLVTVVAEAVEAAALDAEGAGVGLELDGPPSLRTVADGMRLRQAVDNLLANAIAYSRAGGQVRIHLVEEEGRVVLTVADHGEGVDPDDLPQVFTRFFRGDNARRLQVPGTGLGLHIVRTIVEAHGGEIAVESTPGDGTTVTLALPR
ncbi:sensor histidine kinase [Nocardioides hwasunensis]|uniref:histidine kinase n=1 Tax=Nocardioides hwasunensis TaxID=397258 RepID=A0ABR8MLG3_9ACTN|nr:ATP-binding protein [Nocardioides hwasunensis]MBD3916788.1 PAS domain S-box protein [Nocardioides hwasunensis]